MNAKKLTILSLVSTLTMTAAFAVGVGNKLTQTNPPRKCDVQTGTCGCNAEKVKAGCILIQLDAGATTPWTGSDSIKIKVFADDESPMVFTPDSLYVVMGYTYKRIGNAVLSDGETPKEVVFSHPMGEAIRFTFAGGESVARPTRSPDKMANERLMMVDAAGWATTKNPVYWDLYAGDGRVFRFLATDQTGERGKLVYIKDSRGLVTTPADMGVDFVRNADGLRQFLSPSRLVDVRTCANGYDVTIYPIQDVPARDGASGLYAVPNAVPTERLTVRRGDNGRKAVVTLQSGGGEALTYTFTYADNDWSLLRPNGVNEVKALSSDVGVGAIWSKEVRSPSGEVLARDVKYYGWIDDDFVVTNLVNGFGGVEERQSWTYVASGNGKGNIAKETHPSGLEIEYSYDSVERIVRKTRSGPGMMTEVTENSYVSVDPSDVVPPVDARPRTVVRKLNGIECERTYYVYSPLTNIVERVGTQGAAYGGTSALRTVTAFYPIVANDSRSGLVASIRHEDGKLDIYDYALVANLWTETVTHLHEQSPAPVSGKTTRDITITNARGEEIEARTEAYIDGIWYTIAREAMAYNSQGKCIRSEDLAGQVTTTAWDCCHKISETQPDGSTTTWDYDDEGRMIASSRLIPLDMTNVTWLTTCYRYDDLGRQVATWQTNYAAHVGLPVTLTRYDQLGRVIARVDHLGNTTTTEYSPDGRTISVCFPDGAMHITSYSANGDILSVVGTAITPEFTTHGILSDGICWTKIVEGENELSPRFRKHYDNMLVQIVREEHSGFKGAVLAMTHSYDAFSRLVSTSVDYEPTTEYTYDTLGNHVATTRLVGAIDCARPSEWRKNETHSAFIVDAGAIWFTQTNIVSCSDVSIAPLVTLSEHQLTGLTAALPSRSRLTDVRGNVTENETLIDSAIVTSRQTLPYATNKSLSISRYGVLLIDVSVSAVTNIVIYDSLGRLVANTDGRGNLRHSEFNVHGQYSAFVDTLGNRISLAYDRFGNFAAITNAVGNVNIFEFDNRHRKIYEGGATYPARYEYDVFGNKTSMTTYRDEVVGGVGDVTTWRYDEASNCMTNKAYADGKGPTFSFSPDGKLARRVWARGVATDYTYDVWGNLTNIVYSDGTPSISWAYDVIGREIEVRDASGVTTCLYDDFGELTNETVIGVAGTNTIERYWDEFGRTAGYALNGTRQTTLAYDLATGRLLTMQVPMPDGPNNNSPTSNSNLFSWSYLPGSDRKSALTYPNGLTASWQYNADNRLRQVCNALLTNVVSQYDYVYDAAGRRVEVSRSGMIMSEIRTDVYGYNDRSELVSAATKCGLQLSDAAHTYRYDDSGNRIISFDLGTNRAFTANNLNQYMLITNFCGSAPLGEDFHPQFDADGNQTLVKTGSGVWSVAYNGENRPILWNCIQSCNPAVTNNQAIAMTYDRLGRRIACNELCFVYDGYLQISRHRMDGDSDSQLFVWDPTETSATRPLAWVRGVNVAYYTHDGDDKDISEVVSSGGDIVAHYEYAPFGAVTFRSGTDSYENPWRFSSEYADDDIVLSYYNYRHYDPQAGRWLARDPIDYGTYFHEYIMMGNNTLGRVDELGMDSAKPKARRRGRRGRQSQSERCKAAVAESKKTGDWERDAEVNEQIKGLKQRIRARNCTFHAVCGCCVQDDDGKYRDATNTAKDSAYKAEIVLCTNGSYRAQTDYAVALLHELIHAYDHCRKNIKNFTCAERACSEISAYSQCGVCKDGGSARLPEEKEEDCIIRMSKASIRGKYKCPKKDEDIDSILNDQFWKTNDCLDKDARLRIKERKKREKKELMRGGRVR